jgi:tetratricopeptide (TPR) repeat protein
MNMGLIDSIYYWILSWVKFSPTHEFYFFLGAVAWGLLLFIILARITYNLCCKSGQRRREAKAAAKAATPKSGIEVPVQKMLDFLEMRQEELRRDLERMAADPQARAALATQIEVLADNRAHPDKALRALKDKLTMVHVALEGFRGEFRTIQIDQAQEALTIGETAQTQVVLKQALERRPEREAEACHLLGLLAAANLDYPTAAYYYARAANSQPHVLAYLLPAAEFAFFIGNYAESESYLRKALQIKEKAFGHEHPEIAQILSRLAATYGARNCYVEAEALYQWSLEIENNVSNPDRQRLAATLTDYAALLRKAGRRSEAAALEQRAAAILAGQEHAWQPVEAASS